MEGNLNTQQKKERNINLRFTEEEWSLVENARLKMGVRSRGNFLRLYLLPICRNLLNKAEVPFQS